MCLLYVFSINISIYDLVLYLFVFIMHLPFLNCSCVLPDIHVLLLSATRLCGYLSVVSMWVIFFIPYDTGMVTSGGVCEVGSRLLWWSLRTWVPICLKWTKSPLPLWKGKKYVAQWFLEKYWNVNWESVFWCARHKM